MEAYRKLSAQVYEKDKPVGHSFGDLEYYKSRLEGIEGPILEAGLGTGRIYIPLSKAGYKIEAFDLSDSMLEIAYENCKKHRVEANIFKADMTKFKRDKTYQAIILPAGSFMLVYKREESIKALKNFYRHLDNGGRLIVDIEARPYILDKSLVKLWDFDEKTSISLEMKTLKVDYIEQYSLNYHRYDLWEEGRLVESELEKFPLRWYGLEDFKNILKEIGFKDIVISADYEYGKEAYSNYTSLTVEAIK